jgi:hypothetical protein
MQWLPSFGRAQAWACLGNGPTATPGLYAPRPCHIPSRVSREDLFSGSIASYLYEASAFVLPSLARQFRASKPYWVWPLSPDDWYVPGWLWFSDIMVAFTASTVSWSVDVWYFCSKADSKLGFRLDCHSQNVHVMDCETIYVCILNFTSPFAMLLASRRVFFSWENDVPGDFEHVFYHFWYLLSLFCPNRT